MAQLPLPERGAARLRMLASAGLALSVVVALALRHDLLRMRAGALIATALAATGCVIASRAFDGWSRRTPLLVAGAISFALPIVHFAAATHLGVIRSDASLAYVVAWVTASVATAWALAFWLAAACALETAGATPSGSDASPVPEAWYSRHIALIAGVVSFAVLTALHDRVAPGYQLTYDEQVYLMQSRWITAPGFGTMADAELLPFLPQGFFFEHGGRLSTQYPFGWPLMLAGARAAGVLPVIGPLCGALAVAGCAALGRRWLGPAVAASAALLLLTQQWFLEAGIGYMTHAPTTACAVWAAYCLYRVEDARDRTRMLFAGGAGLLLGLALDIRPLTALAIGISLWIWHMLRLRSSTDRWRSTLGLALGGAGPAVLLLAYNRETTGAVFTLGYSVAQGSLHSLGFGLRGYRNAVQAQFTPAIAATNFLERCIGVARDGLAPLLSIPILALTSARGSRIEWRSTVPFLVLPLVYAFYFGSRDRFLVELLPFAALGVATLIWDATPRPWRSAVVIVALGVLNVMFAPEWRQGDLRRTSPEASAITRRLEDMSRERRLLVLVGAGEPRLPFLLGGADDRAAVLVYNSLGEADSVLRRRFPDRMALRVRWDAARAHATLDSSSASR